MATTLTPRLIWSWLCELANSDAPTLRLLRSHSTSSVGVPPYRHKLSRVCPDRAMADVTPEGQLERALELTDARPGEAVTLLREICLAPLAAPGTTSGAGENDFKTRETAVTTLASVLAKQRDAAALRGLLGELRPLFAALPKAKTAKLVRTVIDAVATIPDTTALQVRLELLALPRSCALTACFRLPCVRRLSFVASRWSGRRRRSARSCGIASSSVSRACTWTHRSSRTRWRSSPRTPPPPNWGKSLSHKCTAR